MKKEKWLSIISILLACSCFGTACGRNNDEEEEEADYEVVMATPETIEFSKDISITENEGAAEVLANEGFSYTATGYEQIKGNTFVINSGFTVEFPSSELTDSAFNRFSICYTSTQPLRGTISYTENERVKSDPFFLEAGEHTFSSLTSGYLRSRKGEKITSITLESCNNQSAEFALCLFRTYEYPMFTFLSEETYYIENNKLKLGIHLAWGGGINYLLDKKNKKTIKNQNVENLINEHDTGRLVQQAYYGTQGEGDYKPGMFMGNEWGYNPVQGGDQFNNHSRLIDVVVNDYSVYVKTQPLDWSKYYSYTPSYMEGTYTLMKDHVRVDNRFVDFSGMNHPHKHQELPAFYTLSCLDRFSWYDGINSWTDDTISHRSDLNFWGSSEYVSDSTFRIKESNTETWCAWTNSGANFGVGLYVPNVDFYLAGRNQYDGSISSSAGSTNYVAAVKEIKLSSYTPLEYSYLITAGSLQNIRAIFKRNKDFANNDGLNEGCKSLRVPDVNVTDFSNGVDESIFAVTNSTTTAFDDEKNALKLTVNNLEPYVEFRFSDVYTNSYKRISITYMIPSENAKSKYDCDLLFCANHVEIPTEECSVRSSLIKDDNYHTLTIDLSKYEWWKGKLNSLRFDFFNNSEIGDSIYIKSVKFE